MSSKLTDITNEETTLADGDLLYVVDVDDTTDDPAGSSAKVQVQNLLKAGHFNSEAATDGHVLTADGAGGAAWEAAAGGATSIDDLTDVDTTTSAPAVGEVLEWDGANWVPAASGGGAGTQTLNVAHDLGEFSTASNVIDISLPTGYDYFTVEGYVQSSVNETAAYDRMYCYLNGDTTASNYQSQQHTGSNGSQGSQEETNAQVGYIAGVGANDPSWFKLYIPKPDDTVTSEGRQLRWEYTSPHTTTEVRNGHGALYYHGSDAAITSISLRTDASATNAINGTVRLIGWKNTLVPVAFQGAGAVTVQGKELIATVTPDVNGDFDFQWPAGYDRIIMEGYMKVDQASTAVDVECYINEDTTTTRYRAQRISGINNSASGSEYAANTLCRLNADNADAAKYSHVTIVIESPDSTTLSPRVLTTVHHQEGTQNEEGVGLWTTELYTPAPTARFSSLRIYDANNLLGEMRLYGEKQMTLPVPTGDTTRTIYAEEQLDDTTFSGVSQVDVIVPTGYQDIRFEIDVESSVATNSYEEIRAYLNGDETAANYFSQIAAGNNTTISAGEAYDHAIIAIINSSAENNLARVTVDFPACDGSTTGQTLGGIATYHAIRDEGAHQYIGHSGFRHDTKTEALNKFSFYSSTASNLSGRVRMYGKKQLAVSNVRSAGEVVKEEISVESPVSGEFNFAIPAGYDRIILVANIASTVVADFDQALLYLNSDTTDANYHSQRRHWQDGTTTVSGAESATPNMHYIKGSSAPSYPARMEIVIEDPDTVEPKLVQIQGSYYQTTDSIIRSFSDIVWDTSAALTNVQIRTDNHSTDTLTGTVKVYGEKTI